MSKPRNAKNPEPESKENIAEWFSKNPSRKESVTHLARTLREFFVDQTNHGYINKSKSNEYHFGGSSAEFGNARIIFSKMHSRVRFWLNSINQKINIPTNSSLRKLKSASGDELAAVDFLVKVDSDITDIISFLKLNEIPGWHKFSTPESSEPVSIANFEEEFSKSLQNSKLLSSEQRKARLLAASKKPPVKRILVTSYVRNTDVIVEALEAANGICGDCGCPAPFNRSDGTPYLEVHHKIQLSQGGDDAVDNAIALCPNCHRKRHYG